MMRHFDVLAKEYLVPQESATVSRSEFALLQFLAEQGPSNMSDLSSHIGLALSSTTGVVNRLVERRLVERTRPADDRRTVRVKLTAAGRRALEGFHADRTTMGRGMLERLDARERQALLNLFRKMTG